MSLWVTISCSSRALMRLALSIKSQDDSSCTFILGVTLWVLRSGTFLLRDFGSSSHFCSKIVVERLMFLFSTITFMITVKFNTTIREKMHSYLISIQFVFNSWMFYFFLVHKRIQQSILRLGDPNPKSQYLETLTVNH